MELSGRLGEMIWRSVILGAAAALVVGCAAPTREGAEFSAISQNIGPPKSGNARIVVMREKAYAGLVDHGWPVALDGQSMGELKTGTYLYLDRPAGPHQLSVDEWGFPGVTRHDFAAASGRTYFFVTKVSERSKALSGAQTYGGLAGLAIVAAATSSDKNPGPVDFVAMEESAARTMIAGLRLGN